MRCQAGAMVLAAAGFLMAMTGLAAGQNAPVPPPRPGGSGSGAPSGAAGTTAGPAAQLRPHLLIGHLADAAACAAPDWITPGTRITFFTSVAQINDAAGSVGMVPDPNGDIVDKNGNRFREGDKVGQGVGGSGWDCVDIIAVEPGIIVLEMRQFFNTNGLQGPVRSASSAAFFTHPSGCDFFLHPRLLAQLQQSGDPSASLLVGTMMHRGSEYQIVRSTAMAGTSRLSSVYDLQSGVQLTHNSSTQHDGGTVYKESGGTYEAQRKTGRSLANNQFVETRTLNTPWRNSKPPQWARDARKITYRGQRIDSGTPEMGLGRTVMNLQVEFATQHVGETFISYTTRSIQQFENMPALEPATGTSVTGPGSLGGLWADPEIFNGLQSAQLLDQDASVGIKAGVEYVGQGPDGRPIVVLASGNELYKLTNTYDARDGRMLGMTKIEKSPTTGGMITTQMELVGIE